MAKADKEKVGIFQKLSTVLVDKWRLGLTLWILLLFMGGYVYTSVIPKEGFPPISFPLSFVSGGYLVDDPAKVDSDVAKPISDALAAEELITDVEATSNDNFFTIAVSFDDSLNSFSGTELVEQTIENNVDLPEQVQLQFTPIDPGSFLFEYDMVVQVFARGTTDAANIDEAANFVAGELVTLDIVGRADALDNVNDVFDPATNQLVNTQSQFTRVAVTENDEGQVEFYSATAIGLDRIEGADTLEFTDLVEERIAQLDLSGFEGEVEVVIAADFATDIRSQVSFLESNLMTGLLAVAFVSFLLISWRASIMTALFMLTVMVATIIVLWLIGYTLNVITLFALILSLGLFVDDATIVTEALDVSRRNKKLSVRQAIRTAVGRVGNASFAGTLTTVLVFAILASPTGILGEFIRLIPVTVVTALIVSFFLSITLIPLLSKFIMMRHRDPSWITAHNPILKLEEWLGACLEKAILAVRTWKGKLIAFVAVSISGIMLMSGMYAFGILVDQNIFPPSKDSDQIGLQISYVPGTTIEEAQELATEVEDLVIDTIGDQVVFAYYGAEQIPDAQQAVLIVDLVPFTDREITAPEMLEDLDAALVSFDSGGATIVTSQLDNGPPSAQFPFGIRVYSEDVEILRTATTDFADTMVGLEMENYNGDIVTIEDSLIQGVEGQVLRENGNRYAITRFAYDNENPTLVSLLTEEEFKEIYSDDDLAALGTSYEFIEFDAGQEGDFQDSFNTLALAVPIALLLMYVLLAVQFRSFLQPALILLAIPFTIFGVAWGLYATDNAASFFALTGFIGLIGIAVNNTIMLTDYANQEKRAGAGTIKAIAAASRKRFRPLLATSITTVAALMPLALSDPFWESLAYTIIFGLLSSTFLVIISFPYYYLAAEGIRMWLSKGSRQARKAKRKAAKSPEKTSKPATTSSKKTTAKKTTKKQTKKSAPKKRASSTTKKSR